MQFDTKSVMRIDLAPIFHEDVDNAEKWKLDSF